MQLELECRRFKCLEQYFLDGLDNLALEVFQIAYFVFFAEVLFK